MILVFGIDPGLSGAIAVMDLATRTLLDIHDMPVDRITVGKTVRGRVSDQRFLDMLPLSVGHVFLERPEVRPMAVRDKATGAISLTRMGAMGAFMFGEGYGIVHCACIAAGLTLTEVRPGAWKREMGVSGNKDEARRRAGELFPTFASMFKRKADDGRADAALLALYGAQRTRP